jgi:hypothetical protein
MKASLFNGYRCINSTESLKSVLATFHEVFPHVTVFRSGGAAKGKDLILLGSREPLSLTALMKEWAMRALALSWPAWESIGLTM